MCKYTRIKNINKLRSNLDEIIKKIYSSEDTKTLTEYRKFFKKHVNFFSRSYVAAYLLKTYLSDSSHTTSPLNKSSANSPRKVSLNIGTHHTNKDELHTFLLSLPELEEANISILTQTEKTTILNISTKYLKNLLKAIKTTPFKGKKLFLDLRGRSR